ncbi:hypothetical protein AB4074_03105 [Arthrobacter sp. 2MCAF14]
MDAEESLAELMLALTERNFAPPGDTTSGKPPLTAVSLLAAGHAILKAYQARLPDDVNDARDDGATLAQIARALEKADASTIHSAFGKRRDQDTIEASQEVRRAAARERAAKSRQRAREKYQIPELPGVSALKAAAIMGIDPRTLKSRAKKGNDPHIKAVTATTANGKEVTRFIVTAAGATQS